MQRTLLARIDSGHARPVLQRRLPRWLPPLAAAPTLPSSVGTAYPVPEPAEAASVAVPDPAAA